MPHKEYIVVPIRPVIKSGGKLGDVANQVHEVLAGYSAKGWSYVGIESVIVQLQGNVLEGNQQTTVQVMIFNK